MKLFLFFERYLPLDDLEKAELANRGKLKNVKRRQFVLQEGDVCRHYNFVVRGLFKMYYVDPKGVEHNLEFAAENEWIADIGSFHSETASQLFIEALEPSTIIKIAKPDLLFLYTEFPKFDRNFRVVIEDKFVDLQHRVLGNISASAQQRYHDFLHKYPHLANRLPNTQIASYLGITPEFLSKLRKERLSEK